jgi:flagellin-like hook-associated protein FlgL
MKFLNKQIEGQKIDQKSRVSQLVDTDFAKAILNVQKYEKTYQAALVVHSQIIQTSLVNYL